MTPYRIHHRPDPCRAPTRHTNFKPMQITHGPIRPMHEPTLLQRLMGRG